MSRAGTTAESLSYANVAVNQARQEVPTMNITNGGKTDKGHDW